MAFENLFIRVQRSLGGIQLDSVIEEAHENTIELTQNPIETGVDITDHAIVLPKKVNLRAVVTDSPLGVAAFAAIVDSVTGLFGTSTESNVTRSQQAYLSLVALQEAREPLALVTRLLIYDNMLITSISVTQDKDTSRAVFLNISLEQVIIVESQLAEIDPGDLEEGSTRQQASPTVDGGRKEPQALSDEKSSSVLSNLISLF